MNKGKPKTFDELWEELKQDKEYGEQFRFIDRVVNQDKENERLKQQLAEKDKQIKELSEEHFEMFKDVKNYKNLWLAEQRKNKELHHKICEKIRKSFDEHRKILRSNYDECIFSMDDIIEELEELDQIEQVKEEK